MKFISRFLIAGLLVVSMPAFACEDGSDEADGKIIHTTIRTKTGPVRLHVELATTPKEREIGLMNRTSIGEQDGMLFLFAHPAEQSFWMKNTHIPLDILFIDAKGTISHIVPNATPESLEPLPSGGPIVAALEISGGRAAKTGMHVGDRITYAIPNTVHVQ